MTHVFYETRDQLQRYYVRLGSLSRYLLRQFFIRRRRRRDTRLINECPYMSNIIRHKSSKQPIKQQGKIACDQKDTRVYKALFSSRNRRDTNNTSPW